MTTHPEPYVPINCEFHDLLESLATTRKSTQIHFRDAEGVEQQRNAVIADVYVRNGAEYLLLSTDETLRLDQLVQVDGENQADY